MGGWIMVTNRAIRISTQWRCIQTGAFDRDEELHPLTYDADDFNVAISMLRPGHEPGEMIGDMTIRHTRFYTRTPAIVIKNLVNPHVVANALLTHCSDHAQPGPAKMSPPVEK